MSRRRLGQHFLVQSEVSKRIVEAARIEPGDVVVEIGPGHGALTEHLVKTGAPVVGVEMDASLAAEIARRFGERVSVVKDDALQVDFGDLLRSHGGDQAVLVGNLPYRITGRLLEHILSHRAVWRRAVLMMQREVARRVTASPGTRDYGLLSVSTHIRCAARHLFDVGPEAFSPPPKVYSSVVALQFKGYAAPEVADPQLFFTVARACFQRRRKMVRNSLAGLVTGPVEPLLASARVDGSARPETLSIESFERICKELANVRKTRVDS